MRYIFLITLLLPVLSACNATVRDRDTSVSVSTKGNYNQGTFCPPGQAKKGNC